MPDLPEEILREDVDVLREEVAQIEAEIELRIAEAQAAGINTETW